MDEDIIIKVTIDDQPFKEKPTPEDTKIIKGKLKKTNGVKEIGLKELLKYIRNGQTIFPAVLNGGTKRDNWLEQQIFEVDIDNDRDGDIVKPEDVIDLLRDKNINPFAYYESFNNSIEEPKFRLLFRMKEPVTVIEKAEFIIKTLVDFIPQSDYRCTDVGRLYYGTNGKEKKVIMLDENAVITLEDIIKIYKNPEKENKVVKDKDFWDKVRNYDWLEIVKEKYPVYSESSERTDFIICPICGHKHCFSYYKGTNTFCCYGANGGISGTYIDYLVATEKISLKEAIKKFKKDVLGESDESNYLVAIEEAKKVDYLTIINQMKAIDLYTDHINNIDWLSYEVKESGYIKTWVVCPRLAQFIRENVYYLFARDNAKGAINRYFYLHGNYTLVSDDEIKGVIKACIPLDYQYTKEINEVFNLLITDLKFISIDMLDTDENIINFRNGILYLDTMELKPHSPSILSSLQLPCDYYKYVESPKTHYFDNYIDDLTNHDEEIKLLLLEIMGVALSNVHGYRMKQALFLIGEGNTGKSRLKILLNNMLGKDKCSSIDLKQLETQFGKSQLFNKRLVGTNDLSFFQISSLDTFKQATGGDYINVEFKFENSFDILFKGIMWFCGNRLPYFGGDKGDWIYDRFLIVKCDNVIPPEKRDKFLDEHLWEEKDYIVSLCIKALKRVINNGYKYDIPESCKLANSNYMIENDSFLSFYRECIVDRDPNKPITDNCTRGKIFEVYKAYCRDNNKNYFNTKKEVKQILEKMGKAETIHANGGNIYYKRITLSYDANREYESICSMPSYLSTSIPNYTMKDLQLEEQKYDFEESSMTVAEYPPTFEDEQ